jgi:hypothetical protein
MRTVAMYRHLLVLASCLTTCLSASAHHGSNSTINNPILPGFHPDPSCIFVPEWENTFFCASSSFNAFPGIPIHASKDLQTWKLIGHVLNRKEQLPALGETNRSTRYEYLVAAWKNEHRTDADQWNLGANYKIP